jgi:hypothetical protein
MPSTSPPAAPSSAASEFWRPLLHRWFVQYNPTYLLSSMFVLSGVILLSRGLAERGSEYGTLGVAAVAEVYACALIAAAALLFRIGQRRPAVLLALITTLYQSDLTLHTETCAYLGAVGMAAALAWFLLFVGKLHALAWALRIRLTSRAVATVTLGAAGLAVGPLVLPLLDARGAGTATALFVLALGTLYPPLTEETASSRVTLDDWSRTVLQRSVRATWILWATATAVHVLFWSTHGQNGLELALVAVPFLAIGRSRREWRVWAVVVGLPIAVLLLVPSAFSACTLLAALTLVRRAFVRIRIDAETNARHPDGSPYRAPDVDARSQPAPPPAVAPGLVVVDALARARLLSGALLALHLSAWTVGHHGGDFPAHVLALDAALLVCAVVLARRLRSRAPYLPLAVTWAHGALVSPLLPRPHSLLEWGGTAIALGFVLLFGSVTVSYRLGGRPAGGTAP